MSEPIRRRRRRKIADQSEADLSLVAPPDTETQEDDVSQGDRQITVDSNIKSHQTTIDRIRSEIHEDKYHCLLNEPDYSNDTHDWSDNNELVSSDYWHFLGSYE